MKKIDLAQSIQLLANLGVIAGIVFLAFEVRQNNDFLRADAEYRIFEHRTNFRREMYRDQSLTDLVIKAGRGEDLSIEEFARVANLYRVLYQGMSWEFRQYEAGRATDYPIGALKEAVTSSAFAQQLWREFVEELDESNPSFLRFLEENGLADTND